MFFDTHGRSWSCPATAAGDFSRVGRVDEDGNVASAETGNLVHVRHLIAMKDTARVTALAQKLDKDEQLREEVRQMIDWKGMVAGDSESDPDGQSR